MKIKNLITGAAGFIGYHLATKLADRGDRVVLVDNLERGAEDSAFRMLCARPNVSFHEVDLTDPIKLWPAGYADSLRDALEGITDVYHLAAVNGTSTFYDRPSKVLRTNLLSLIHVLDWMKQQPQMPRLLFTSSNEAYAGLEAMDQLRIPTPEAGPLVVADPYNPRWSYGGSKLVGEQLVIHTAKDFEFPAVIVRPHNFYGPRAGMGHVIPQMIDRIARREDPFRIWGPEQTRSFCYIDDAVDGMVRAMDCASPEVPTFHIGSLEETRIRDLADRLFAICDWTPRGKDYLDAPAGSVARRMPDTSKLRTHTGWRCNWPLEDGLRKTALWYLTSAVTP